MKKNIGLFLICMFMFTVLTGCNGGKEQETVSTQPIKATVSVLRGPTALGMIKMIDEKTSPSGNVNMQYVMEQSPEVLSSKIVSGEVDFATIPTNMAANLYNKGVAYQLAGVSVWGVMYVVTNGVEINTWSDLKGQEISCAGQGAASDQVFRYLLKENKINPDTDVHMSYVPSPVELAQATIAGKTKIAVLPEPWVSNALKANPNLKLALDVQEQWTIAQTGIPLDQLSVVLKKKPGENRPYAQTCLVVKKEFAQAHPQIVNAFLKQYADEIMWVNTHPTEAAKLVEKHQLGLTAWVAESSIPRCNLGWADSKEARPAVEQFLTVMLNSSPQSIGGKLPDDQFYYQN